MNHQPGLGSMRRLPAFVFLCIACTNDFDQFEPAAFSSSTSPGGLSADSGVMAGGSGGAAAAGGAEPSAQGGAGTSFGGDMSEPPEAAGTLGTVAESQGAQGPDAGAACDGVAKRCLPLESACLSDCSTSHNACLSPCQKNKCTKDCNIAEQECSEACRASCGACFSRDGCVGACAAAQ